MDTQILQQKLETPPTEGRKQAVLLSTGSLCPIHKGHLQIIDVAAKFLSEKCQIDPLVGYISPSCDLYVGSKLGPELIPFQQRYEMVKLACEEHNQISGALPIIPDSWEGLQPDFIDFPCVKKYFENQLKKLFPDKNLLVLYVTGADHFNKCGLNRASGYVAVSRVGYKINGKTCPDRNLYICSTPEYNEFYSDTSSTIIRNAMKKGQSIDGLTYDSVVKYLNENVHVK